MGEKHLRDLVAELLVCAFVGGWGSTVHAMLGEPKVRNGLSATPSEPTGSAQRLAAQNRPVGAPWTAQQTTLDTGTTVQEFSTANGIVFAVTWQGPVLPDLQTLLGKHFLAYAKTASQARENHRFGGAVLVTGPELVMHSGGRMRNFSGYAYVPALVPAGVNIADLLP